MGKNTTFKSSEKHILLILFNASNVQNLLQRSHLRPYPFLPRLHSCRLPWLWGKINYWARRLLPQPGKSTTIWVRYEVVWGPGSQGGKGRNVRGGYELHQMEVDPHFKQTWTQEVHAWRKEASSQVKPDYMKFLFYSLIFFNLSWSELCCFSWLRNIIGLRIFLT